jgi:hypothetical protein
LRYDDVAKENLKKLLDNLENVKVIKFADYKRSVEISNTNDKVEERKVIGLKKKNQSVNFDPKNAVSNSIKKPDYSKSTKIEVMKNYSKHRVSSKIFGVGKEDSYSLSINGKHFVSDIRGEEGKTLVSNKITKAFWEILSELSTLQEDKRKNIISEEEYNDSVTELKNKWFKWFGKLK